MTTWNNGNTSSTSKSLPSAKSGPLILEIRTISLRVRLAYRTSPHPLMKRIHRVRVLFPDLGAVPVIDSVGFERLNALDAIREFPAVRQVSHHLADLTTIY